MKQWSQTSETLVSYSFIWAKLIKLLSTRFLFTNWNFRIETCPKGVICSFSPEILFLCLHQDKQEFLQQKPNLEISPVGKTAEIPSKSSVSVVVCPVALHTCLCTCLLLPYQTCQRDRQSNPACKATSLHASQTLCSIVSLRWCVQFGRVTWKSG